MNIKNLLFVIIAAFALSSCSDKPEEEIVSSFPNGTPSLINYYKWYGDSKMIVKEVRYYQNGEKQYEGEYKNGEKHGLWVSWFENGEKWSEANFADGISEGRETVWYKSGVKNYEGHYGDGKLDGKWTFWDGDGNIVKEVNYENGVKLN
jgi:antitoxin component YwqK of YwqJK toxin-antitoxin module